MRFMMTAKAVALGEREGLPMNDITKKNISKVTRYRQNGQSVFDDMVDKFRNLNTRRGDRKAAKSAEESS